MPLVTPIIGLLRPTEANDYYKGESLAVREIHGEDSQYIMGIDSDGEEIFASKVYWYFEPLQQTREEGVPVHDPVNNPSHYQLLPGVEVIDVLDALCNKLDKSESLVLTGAQNSYYAQMMGYLMRCMDKNGLQDMKKARFYLDRIIKQQEGEGDE